MMRLNQLQTQALGCIADGVAGSDPRLASMLTIFSRLAAGQEMPAREKTRVRRAEMAGAAAKLAARWSPGCGRSARGSGPLPYRSALPVCQQIAAGGAQLLQSRGVVELSRWRRPTRSWWRWLRGGPWFCYHQLFAVLLRFDGRG